MIVTPDVLNNRLILDASPGNGYAGFAKNLVDGLPGGVPPAGSRRMMAVFRAWWDSYSARTLYNKAWNHSSYFGLGFDGATLGYDNDAGYDSYKPAGHFGWILTGPSRYSDTPYTLYPNYAGVEVYPGSPNHIFAFVWSGSSGYNRYNRFLDGMGGSLHDHYGYFVADSLDTIHALPANPTQGAIVTTAWEIWASENDKTMYARACVALGSLEGEAMFTAFDTPYLSSLQSWTLHGNVTSVYRPSFEQVVFPTWLKARHSLPSGNMVIDVANCRLRFWDWQNNIL